MRWPFNFDKKKPKPDKSCKSDKPATLGDLLELKQTIMSAISVYAEAVNASFDKIDESCKGLGTAVGGVADDVAYLKEVIDKLQNNPGPISPEDQALLDAAQARAADAASKLEGVRQALATLDAATTRPETPTIS